MQQIETQALLDPRSPSTPSSNQSKATQASRILWVGKQTYAKAQKQPSLSLHQHAAWHELMERALRQQLQKEKALMDSGLGWLASIGGTAPFIGLFGTVSGIMHALKDISEQGNASLEVVAGPIGEALIVTALDIAVAIPAVIAYNFFLRQNRQQLVHLEHIGNDFLQRGIEHDLMSTHQEPQHVPTNA